MMTGESVPAEVAEGGAVTAGTVVVSGRLVVRAVKTGHDTQLAHLIALVEHAQAEKSPVAAARRPDLRSIRPGRPGRRGLTLAGWLMAGSPAEPGVQRRAGGADHRLPVRAGSGDPGRAGGGLRAGRAAGHLHQGIPGAGGLPQRGHRCAGQDRDHHHRGDGRDRRAARARHQPGRAAAPARRGRARVGAPGRRRGQRRRRGGARGRCPRPTGSRRCPAWALAGRSTATR